MKTTTGDTNYRGTQTRLSTLSRFWLLIIAFTVTAFVSQRAIADSSPQVLPFSQNWTSLGLITLDDDWSGAPGFIGYRGDGLTTVDGVDPQTITADGTTVVDVLANRTNPNTLGTGGVGE